MQASSAAPIRNNYDHRIRNAVCATGDCELFDGIPASTQRTWIRRGAANVISLDGDVTELTIRIQTLERANRRLRNVIRLLLALIRAFGLTLDTARMPSASGKRILLRAIRRASESMPRRHALRVLKVTPSRFAAWEQADTVCRLDDQPSCPRSRPMRISARELDTMRLLTMSKALVHFPIRALALFAQRQDLVHVSVGTWYRTIKKRGWRRPRFRIHPRSPSVGLRATYAGQYLHVDITVIKLLDGTIAYVQAIIDNFSRLILAHAVSRSKTARETAALIRQARSALGVGEPEVTVVADDGGENVADNVDVSAALSDCDMTMLIAQTDILSSNSMIERFWSSMKHNFLFMQRLSSITALRRFADFYVVEHNTVIPHNAFQGQTPIEVFRGVSADVPELLASKRAEARQLRVRENQRADCGACPGSVP